MKSIPTLFFGTAAVFALVGMALGISMGIRDDFTLAPAHAHLNLIGFVVMSVFGIFYALTPRAARSRLAVLHYVMVTAAVVTFIPGIALTVTEQGGSEFLVTIGAVLAFASMAFFLFMVLRFGVGAQVSGTMHAREFRKEPAE